MLSGAGDRFDAATGLTFLPPPPQRLTLPVVSAPALQSALLGCCMYQLIQLSDLEADFLNPHDAARNINRVVVGGGWGSAAICTRSPCSATSFTDGLLHSFKSVAPTPRCSDSA